MANASHQVHAATESCAAVWRDLMRAPVAYLVIRRQSGAGDAVRWYVFAVDEHLAEKIEAAESEASLEIGLHLDEVATAQVSARSTASSKSAAPKGASRAPAASGPERVERGGRRLPGFGSTGGGVPSPVSAWGPPLPPDDPPPSARPPARPAPPPAPQAPHRGAIPAASPRPAPSLAGPAVILDERGHSLGIAEPNAVTEPGMVYPSLTKQGAQEITPGQVAVFDLALSLSAPLGTAIGYAFDQPADGGDTTILAQVSSSSLCPADDAGAWSQAFTISSRSGPMPSRWTFRARAADDWPVYELIVAFSQGGRPLGMPVRCRLPRRGNDAFAPGAQISAGPLRLWDGGPLPSDEHTMAITMEGSNQYLFRLFRGGALVCAPESWAMNMETFFTVFAQSATLDDLRNKGSAMFVNLPRSVKEFLSDRASAEAPLHIVSEAVLMPFELITDDDGQFLGGTRPISRWILNTDPLPGVCSVSGIATICPEYAGDDALPAALLEGTDLEALFGGANRVPFRKVKTEDDFAALLGQSDIQLVHFAGHSNSDPASLVLQGNVRVSPERFAHFRPLLKERPVMFLNGCRAGFGTAATPAMLSNMPVALLSAGCRGVVAPLVKVDSNAARTAAATFYKAVMASETVAEAVRRVRLEGEAAGAGDRLLSYMSYVAYGPPDLVLDIR